MHQFSTRHTTPPKTSVPSIDPRVILAILPTSPSQSCFDNSNTTIFQEYGLLLQLAPAVKGLAPNPHLGDTPAAAAKIKAAHPAGSSVTGRVWTTDPASARTTVTLRAGLVSPQLPPVTCFEDATPGSRTVGLCVGTAAFGAFIEFYGGVRGLIHRGDMESAG